jgi:hypothetical protein
VFSAEGIEVEGEGGGDDRNKNDDADLLSHLWSLPPAVL